jgi:hypothetical protein
VADEVVPLHAIADAVLQLVVGTDAN